MTSNRDVAVRPWHRLLLVGLVLLVASCTPRNLGLQGHRPTEPLAVGDVEVREVRLQGPSTPFAFRALPGQLLCVFFGYARCPDICPTTFAELRRALRIIGADSARVEVAFVSVDPVRDSAAVLVPFLHAFVPGSHALRPASQQELAIAERAFGATSSIAKKADGSVDVSHTGLSYVVDSGGHVLLQWDYGTRSVNMAADLRILLRLQGKAP